MIARRCWARPLALLAFLSSSQAAPADSLLDRFRDEAPKKWMALHDSAMHLQGKIEAVNEPIEGLPETAKVISTHTVKGFGDGFLHHFRYSSSGNVVDNLRGVNSDYAFMVKRPKADADKPWTIGYLGQDRARVLGDIQKFGEPIFVSHQVDGQDLAWTVAQPGFRINALTEVVEGARKLAKLDFSSSDYRRKDYQIKGGTVLLDPARSWSVVGFDLRLQLDVPASATGTVEYGADIAGCPVPLGYRMDFKARDAIGPLHRRITAAYALEAGTGPPSEFRLDHYGLPEPGKPKAGGWPFWAWSIAFAACSLFLSIALRVRSRTSERLATTGVAR